MKKMLVNRRFFQVVFIITACAVSYTLISEQTPSPDIHLLPASDASDSNPEQAAPLPPPSNSAVPNSNDSSAQLQFNKTAVRPKGAEPVAPISKASSEKVPKPDNLSIAQAPEPNEPSAEQIAQSFTVGSTPGTAAQALNKPPVKTILINFNNVGVIEFIRFLSKISNKNFVFDEADLPFNVTIVSEEPTTIDNIMSALLQELRIHGLTFLEQGNNIVIHKNAGVNSITRVVADNITPAEGERPTEIVTQLFRLNTADPEKVAVILRPLLSERSLIEVFKDTNHIIITDIIANVHQAAQLIKSLDAPNNGLVIGQYVVRSGFIDSLIQLAQKIMQPISPDQTLIFVPHRAVNSIFIVSTPFLLDRTMGILQYLDQNQGITRVFDLKDLKFSGELGAAAAAAAAAAAGKEGALPGEAGGAPIPPPSELRQGKWEVDNRGHWVFRPLQQPGVPISDQPPQGYWSVDDQGNWRFQSGSPPPSPTGTTGLVGPEGNWVLDSQGIWVFQLAPGKSISPERLVRPQFNTSDLPVGHIERTQFFIYKLRYRKGEQVQYALSRIATSLMQSGSNNVDLVAAIESVQWIEASNSLIFTGVGEALGKVQELILEIDIPLRQVFIEMLILQTTLDDSLNYGVNWGTRFGGGNTSGSQAFLSAGSVLPNALDTAEIGSTPDASSLARTVGFSQGIIGQHLTHGGLHFNSIGALIKAIHDKTKTNIILNPKLLMEDNVPAEVFVGLNTAFPTQAIVNNNGNIVTQNFDFRDVGISVKITPLISDDGMVTLTILESVSSLAPSNPNTGTVGGPTTNINRTSTKVHLPDGYFLIISGMMQDQNTLHRLQIPCLGGIPFIGAAFSDRAHTDTRNNLMIFLRPKIIDTEEDIDCITKREQDIFKYKNRTRSSWRYETYEALDYLNLPNPDTCCEPDDCGCSY